MSSHLFFWGLDAIGTGLLVTLAYMIGKWGKKEAQAELEISNTCLRESLTRESNLSGENHLLWDLLYTESTNPIPQPKEEVKVCVSCKVPYPISNFHTNRNDCKGCRAHREKEKTRLAKLAQEVAQ